jgi:phage terminase large subunit-like protein
MERPGRGAPGGRRVITPPAGFTYQAWAEAVRSGETPANSHQRRAVDRFFRDLEQAEAKGMRFDEAAAHRAIGFIELLRHSKGEWRGKLLRLGGWQQFIVANLFGWRWLASGLRRFKRAYVEVPRKNGKSTLAAAIAIFMLVADGEGAPEVYTAATSRDQAKLVFEECRRMVRASPYLSRRVAVYKDELTIDNLDARLMALHSKSENLDGLNTHCGIVDEYHEHRNAEVCDKIRTSTGARRQALIFVITTAGDNLECACYIERSEAIRVVERTAEDDAFFVFIACMDDDDDWTQRLTWQKANPNYGVSRYIHTLEEDFATAKNSPLEEAKFKRYFLNKWTNEETRWLRLDDWRACAGEPMREEDLAGLECYGGMDLSSVKDMTAVVWYFPERRALLCRFFMPRENLAERERRDRVPFRQWVKAGYIIQTEGNVTDTEAIRDVIRADAERFKIREIAFDSWNTLTLVSQLMADGFTMVRAGQDFRSMNAPAKQLEKFVVSHQLWHGGHPVLQWMASNVCVAMDRRDNIAPVKRASFERIDGIVCGCMALGRAILQVGDGVSVYESRGVMSL